MHLVIPVSQSPRKNAWYIVGVQQIHIECTHPGVLSSSEESGFQMWLSN